MITGISIENFKGIGERVHLDLKPITLLFGPNSAGKSSILHALHYAAEIFERRNLNADHTVIGGESVDLGGFATLVHGHDLDRTVWLRFDFDAGDAWCDAEYPSIPAINEYLRIQELLGGDATEIFCASGVSVEIGVRWSATLGQPYVATYRVFSAGRGLLPVSHPDWLPPDLREDRDPKLVAEVSA